MCEFVRLRIEALRQEHPGEYQNVSALRTNSMLASAIPRAKTMLRVMGCCPRLVPPPHPPRNAQL